MGCLVGQSFLLPFYPRALQVVGTRRRGAGGDLFVLSTRARWLPAALPRPLLVVGFNY